MSDKLDNRVCRHGGFTLVETILAAAILAAAALTLTAGATGYLTQAEHNRRLEKAVSLADTQLSLVDNMGIEDFMASGISSGVADEPQGRYDWQVEITPGELQGLYDVQVTISWLQAGARREYVLLTKLPAGQDEVREF